MGLNKKEREERKAYMKSLMEQNLPIDYVLKTYDAKYGTHYYERGFPLAAKARKEGLY